MIGNELPTQSGLHEEDVEPSLGGPTRSRKGVMCASTYNFGGPELGPRPAGHSSGSCRDGDLARYLSSQEERTLRPRVGFHGKWRPLELSGAYNKCKREAQCRTLPRASRTVPPTERFSIAVPRPARRGGDAVPRLLGERSKRLIGVGV